MTTPGDGSKVKRWPLFRRSTFLLFIVTALFVGAVLLFHSPSFPRQDDSDTTTFKVASGNLAPITTNNCLTIVGDTMIQNGSKNYASSLSTPRDAFGHLEVLLKCRYVLANLEGPVTTLGIEHSPKQHPSPAYSFNMDPSSLDIFKQVGITHFGRSNNHLRDRGEVGVQDTLHHLQQAQLPHFGSGITKQQAATPLVLEMNPFMKVGITAFSDQYKVIAGESLDNETGVLPVTREHALLGQELLDQESLITTRIAYVHWGKNYGNVDDKMKSHARLLAQYGYDFIVGSDGSHTVQKFEYVNGIPVLYNVGNFCFQTPGRYRGMKKYMPFGSVLNVIFDENGKPALLELYCAVVDNKVVEYQPQLCSPSHARTLFKSLGKHVKHTKGTVYATVSLQPKNEEQ